MAGNSVNGIQGWTWVYIIGSIPVLLFHAAGLAGWFFDYPLVLFLVIFLLLAIPLLLLLVQSPEAPQWNIAMLWTASILITLRIAYGLLFQRVQEGQPPLSSEELLGALPTLPGIVAFSLGWAMLWTRYFKRRLS